MLVTHNRFHKLGRSAAPFLFGVVGLTPVTLICFWIHIGLGTVALLYLMVVVLVSLKGSFVSSALVSYSRFCVWITSSLLPFSP
jgi:hypothetical protein